MAAEGLLRFAVVGAGVVADVHARAVRSLPGQAELALVVSRRLAAAKALAEAHDAARYTTDLTEALADPSIDAVSICTPSGTHADLAVAALEAGKHVMVEKPIDVSLEAADRIVSAERASGRQVAVVSQHRFDPATEKTLAAVASGSLGRLTSGIASCPWWRSQAYYDSGLWRGTWALDGGGAIMNQSIHTIDLLLAAMGQPVEVTGYSATLGHEGIEVEDTAAAVVRFQSGALGVIHGTTAAFPGMDTSLRLYGTGGSAVIVGDELAYLAQRGSDRPEPRARTAAHRHPPESAFAAQFAAQYADFIDAIRSGRPPRVGTAEARTAHSVVLALYESATSGTAVRLVRA